MAGSRSLRSPKVLVEVVLSDLVAKDEIRVYPGYMAAINCRHEATGTVLGGLC